MQNFKRRSNIGGFTLIELLIVIAIAVILVFALMTAFSGTQRVRAEDMAERTGRKLFPRQAIIAACASSDSDADGKIGCTITHDGVAESFECSALTSVGSVSAVLGDDVFCSPMKARIQQSYRP